MRAIKFKGCNVNVAENQDEYLTLPALKFDDAQGNMVTCYQLSFLERLRVLFLGRIWMLEMTFNKPITPRLHSTKRSDLFKYNENL